MHFGGANPVNNSNYNVEVATGDTIFYDKAFNFINVSNITFRGSNSVLAWFSGSYLKFEDCDFMFSGKDNVRNEIGGYNIMRRCNIINSNNTGVTFKTNNDIIEYCLVKNSGLIPGLQNNGNGQSNGIYAYNPGSVVRYNKVVNTGYTGIHFYRSSNTLIYKNWVDSFQTTKDDAGGIYGFNNNTGKQVTVSSNIIIRKNIITNGIASNAGTPDRTVPGSAGVYFDGETNGVLADSNTVTNCAGHGFYFNNTRNVTVRDNNVYNCSTGGVYLRSYIKGITRDTTFTNPQHTAWSSIYVYEHDWKDNKIRKNLFLMKNAGNLYIDGRSDMKPYQFDNFKVGFLQGAIDSNMISRPIGEPDSYVNDIDDVVYLDLDTTSNSTIKSTLAQWKTKYSSWYDQHSTKTALGTSIASANDILPLVNTADHDSVFTLDYPYVNSYGEGFKTGTATIAPFDAEFLLKIAGSLATTNNPPTVAISYPIQGVDGLNPRFYTGDTINVTVNASDADGITNVKLYNGSQYLGANYSAPYTFKVPAGLSERTITLTAVATDSKGLSTTSAAQTFQIYKNIQVTDPDSFNLKKVGKFKVN